MISITSSSATEPSAVCPLPEACWVRPLPRLPRLDMMAPLPDHLWIANATDDHVVVDKAAIQPNETAFPSIGGTIEYPIADGGLDRRIIFVHRRVEFECGRTFLEDKSCLALKTPFISRFIDANNTA